MTATSYNSTDTKKWLINAGRLRVAARIDYNSFGGQGGRGWSGRGQGAVGGNGGRSKGRLHHAPPGTVFCRQTIWGQDNLCSQ